MSAAQERGAARGTDAEERSVEASLRPVSLGEYIGQGEAKRSLTTLLQAAREHGLSLEHSFMVGDKPSDIEAARAAGAFGR